MIVIIINPHVYRFLGISQTLPTTSYVKMIDVWMLFTMTVPFLEVVLHTCTEVMKRRKGPYAVQENQVKPEQEDQVVVAILYNELAWVGVMGRTLVPIFSTVFTIIFWTVGLVVSYWPRTKHDPNMSNCANINLH